MFTPTTLARGAAALALLGSLSLTACSSGEPEEDAGESELITQVTLVLTPTDGGTPLTITATASNGEVIDTFSPTQVTLRPGTTYDGRIELLDTINNIDITNEVRGEAEEHLFRYAFEPGTAGTVTITDSESDYQTRPDQNENGGDFAVGLRFRAQVAAGASGTGAMRATLYHFDDAPKTSSTATSDEIDVEVAFPVRFQASTAAATN